MLGSLQHTPRTSICMIAWLSYSYKQTPLPVCLKWTLVDDICCQSIKLYDNSAHALRQYGFVDIMIKRVVACLVPGNSQPLLHVEPLILAQRIRLRILKTTQRRCFMLSCRSPLTGESAQRILQRTHRSDGFAASKRETIRFTLPRSPACDPNAQLSWRTPFSRHLLRWRQVFRDANQPRAADRLRSSNNSDV